jgi:ligand-binding sensor domain-containing protein
MRKPPWLLLAAIPAVFGLGIAAFVLVRVQHTLNRATVSVAREGRFPMELRTLGRMENRGFEAIATPVSYRSGAFFHGKLYISGPSGLFVYGAGDAFDRNSVTLRKSYRVGLDLPPAPLGQMVVGRLRGASEPELLIATAGEGVLIFSANGSADGSGIFRQIRPKDAEARDVTALLPMANGELLIGTPKRGLLVYRGTPQSNPQELETFHPQLSSLAVTALAADDTGFWVGTRNQGVRRWNAGEIDSFGTDSSRALPDDQVDAIAVDGDKVFVGTPLGVEEFVNGRPARVLAKNVFANALFADDRSVTVGSIEDGIQRVSLESNRRPGARYQVIPSQDGSGSAEQFLRAGAGDPLLAILHNGLSEEQTGGNWSPLATTSSNLPGHSPVLTDGNVSALAFDPDGRLWVGYFDRGIDILSANGERIEHHEDDHLFCVNRIVVDPQRKTMAVATANGLVLFGGQTGKQSTPGQVLSKRDGLIADHITDVAFSDGTMVVATPAGLTFMDASGARSMYAFEGLVNNHVYALGVRAQASQSGNNDILAGTLGGISLLTHESIRRNLTVSNSGLQHNWVTAIVPVSMGDSDSSDWMVGTYGAGVMRLDKDGRFAAMEGATRAMDVNPNAMLTTRGHIFAGTLGHGLWVWSRASDRWIQIEAGLPSESVTAIAEHGGEIYVGTDNGLVRIAERLLD